MATRQETKDERVQEESGGVWETVETESDEDKKWKSHVQLKFSSMAAQSRYTVKSAMLHFLRFVRTNLRTPIYPLFYKDYLIVDGERKGHLMMNYERYKKRLVIVQVVLYPKGGGAYVLEHAADAAMEDDEVKDLVVGGVAMQAILFPPLQAKLEARGWRQPYPGCRGRTVVWKGIELDDE